MRSLRLLGFGLSSTTCFPPLPATLHHKMHRTQSTNNFLISNEDDIYINVCGSLCMQVHNLSCFSSLHFLNSVLLDAEHRVWLLERKISDRLTCYAALKSTELAGEEPRRKKNTCCTGHCEGSLPCRFVPGDCSAQTSCEREQTRTLSSQGWSIGVGGGVHLYIYIYSLIRLFVYFGYKHMEK